MFELRRGCSSWFRVALCVCALLTGTMLHAQTDHIVERSYWLDTSAQANQAFAAQQVFTPYQGVLSKGYTNAAVWIKLKIKAEPDQSTDQLILRMRPVYLDEIRLFDPLDTSGAIRITGDRTDYGLQEYESLSHTFAIPMGAEDRFIYLRLKATSTSLLHVEALTAEDMRKSEHRMLMVYFLVLALITVFVLLVFINWLNFKEYLYAVFIIRHLLYLTYTAAFFGFNRMLLADWIDAKHLDIIYNWLVIGTTAFSIWFEYQFLSEYAPPLWVKRCLHGLMAWSGLAFCLLLFQEFKLALQINMTLNGFGVFTFFILSAIFIKDNRTDLKHSHSLLKKKIVVGYYGLINILLWANVLPSMGLTGGNEFALNGLISYSLCSGVVMTVLMQLRANQLKQSNLQFSQELMLSSQQVALEKIKREEQSQLLTMLMHELKNPLAVIDLAQHAQTSQDSQNYVSRNVAIIKDILDRCLNADRVSNGKLLILHEPVNLCHVIEEVMSQQNDDLQRLQWHCNISDVTVSTDEQCFRIMLNNLIANALRYGDQASPVEVQLNSDATNAEVRITVSNKPGLAGWPEADKVFQKYYRSPGAKTLSGTGLGLYLVASIAQVVGAQCRYVPDERNIRFELCLAH